ncbi:hypothetical protein B6A42_07405 [Vibrio coralliilyticus]|uniref:Uncharacterized protein n=1 Tax=Vibrio coralliilyticus TaxID=190893 RepID=A0AAN0SB35_9VIBR|nr:hypothetical protein IX92_05870 [Vibrio coralliilyticus]ARC91953.1 hypothetical protein B6A42_07405 [Vibrio coralliilyticus]
MGWYFIINTTSTWVIMFIVLQPIYHHKKALQVVAGLLFLYFGLGVYNFNYGYSSGDITSFAMFSAAQLSFLAQLRYSRQIKSTHGFYPRLYYKRFPIKGIYIKHPDIDRAHSEPDTIMTILAFLGFVLGLLVVLFIDIASRS